MDTNQLWVVIAAFNEKKTISNTVTQVLHHVKQVVVVDDCSQDDTAQKALAAGAHVLRHPVNLGQGGALQTGIAYALKNGAGYIVTFDADGQHDATEILPMLSALQHSQATIALGSRFLGKTVNLPWQRRLILKTAIMFTRITAGIKLTDVHNGFRVMTRQFCENFTFRQNKMAHASEILTHIARKHITFIEYPVTITYTEHSLQKGQRHSNSLRILMELFMGYIAK